MQKELAEAIGMSEIGLSKALDGSATKSTLDRIANYLNVDVDSLILEEKVLRAKYGSDKTPLRFGELEIPCYVLEDGTRVLSGRGIQKALGSTSPSGAWLSRFINNGALSELFSAGVNSISERINNPIQFIRNNAGGSQSATNGYEATLLIDICSSIIDENRAGRYDDSNIVRCADIIIRSVAKVGIIALIDEATGYDKERNRAKDELQKFLSTFIREEAAKWVKRFPDSFFEDIYKMRGWTWANTSKRPGVVGSIVRDLVYDRLGPMVRSELERLNPKNDNGNRRAKHHQFLTEIGNTKLSGHLEALHALAVLSNHDWPRFMLYVDKTYPKQYQQWNLFDIDDFD
ncbi:MAG: P63C domain-containing protein [Lachnospiraceae bacterium]|nr:P63C domain-containing protein [Lachnospiraceae bacterium]